MIKICTSCLKTVNPGLPAPNYTTTEGTIYYFHDECFQKLCDERGKVIFGRVLHAVLNFSRAGFHTRIHKEQLKHYPKSHVTLFEPPKHKKLDDLEMILECLTFYKGIPLTRKQIAKESLVPYQTVCWRIWDNLEGRVDIPLFYIHPKKGPRGIELIGLVTHK